MPYLQMAYTDATGTAHAEAVVIIRSVRLQYEPPNNAAEVAVSIYHDAQAYADGKAPVEERGPTALTDEEVDTYVATFGATAYQVLQQRPEFTGAELVVE